MILKGRRKIVSEARTDDLMDELVLAEVINASMIVHTANKSDIDYLIGYKNGIQPILSKTKPIREDINNKVVINHAQMITRMINGYFLGTPIQYIQSGNTDKKDDIDRLNKYVAYEDKHSVDCEIGEYQSICGTAYRIIYTDGLFADEVPFEDKALNPATTFVVYENNIAEKPLMGVTYYSKYDFKGNELGKKIFAYTEFGVYTIETDDSGTVNENSRIKLDEYKVGGIPIIEYPNNQWRIGDWELTLGLQDAISSLQSGRLDDVDQMVQSLLVFINADIDAGVYDEMREKGVVVLKNMTSNQSDVKNVTNELDQSGMNMFAGELETLLYALIGIPDRNSRSGGGGDTGQAVELRDGWADLEIVARTKEAVYKKSEKQALRIILNITNNKEGTNLSLLDVDIKFSRNKSNNLLVKTQGYSTLLATKTLSPQDCLTIVDLVSDVNEYISRGQEFWGSAFAGLEQATVSVDSSKVALETAKNPPVVETTKKEGASE